uniref:Uncharacterized protein n=1 Tax=Gouania willdenowi TaxID=441366 RepID=A0A8C5DK38_GOUWI
IRSWSHIKGLSMWRYNLVTHTWQEMSPMQKPRALMIVAYMGHIYAVGGRYGSKDLRSAEAYDPVTNTWYDVPEMVHRHRYFGIAVMNKQIFVVSCSSRIIDISTFLFGFTSQ